MEKNKILAEMERVFGETFQINLISGDASSRVYYRARSESKSYILSVDNIKSLQNHDFVKLTKLFISILRTPKIEYVSKDETLVVQEDVGNETFLSFIGDKSREKQEQELKRLIDDIIKYQSISIDEFKKYSSYEFDDKKIDFEVDLAEKYFMKYFLKKEINIDIFKNLVLDTFRKNKMTVCHRDYHSRNILMLEDEIVHIDYQDARIGPRSYDLASLLEDCYISYSKELKEILITYYIKKTGIDEVEFRRVYKIVAAQRLFKALGSFAYLKIEKNKGQYERFISKTFEEFKQIISEIKELKDFHKDVCRAFYAS